MTIHEGNFQVIKDMVTDGKFNRKMPDIVTGDFKCAGMKLVSLDGCPKEVGHDFLCFKNNLTNLEGGPTKVGKGYFAANNKITSLKGLGIFNGSLTINANKLTSLEGCPEEIVKYFNCSNNLLSSLEGGPTKVGNDYYCQGNLLTSLKGAPNIIKGSFNCNVNLLTDLEFAPTFVQGSFFSHSNRVSKIDHIPYVIEAFITDNNVQFLEIEKRFMASGFLKKPSSYWRDLMDWMMHKKYNLDQFKAWPDSFLKSLDDETKNLFRSSRIINKFNL